MSKDSKKFQDITWWALERKGATMTARTFSKDQGRSLLKEWEVLLPVALMAIAETPVGLNHPRLNCYYPIGSMTANYLTPLGHLPTAP